MVWKTSPAAQPGGESTQQGRGSVRYRLHCGGRKRLGYESVWLGGVA